MRTTHHLPSVCRHCSHYSPQGRRGGMCQKLSAPVRGNWQACCLANSPFVPTWENWEVITLVESPQLKPVKVAQTHTSHSTIEICSNEVDQEQHSETILSA